MLQRYHKLHWDKRKIYRSHLAVDLFWFNRKGKRRLTRLLIVYIGLAKINFILITKVIAKSLVVSN